MFSCHVDVNALYVGSRVLLVYRINNALYVLFLINYVRMTDRRTVKAIFDYQLRQSVIDNRFFRSSFE